MSEQTHDGVPNMPAWMAWAFVLSVIAGSAAILGTFVLIAIDLRSGSTWQERGTMGDFYGGHIAAGGSLAGTFFFVAALLMQGRELNLQRQELAASRREMIESRKAYEAQEVQLRRQVEIADKTAIISRYLELIRIKDDMSKRHKAERAPYMSGVVSEIEPKRKAVDAKWSARFAAMDELLADLLGRQCIDEKEKDALSGIGDLF